MLEFIDNHAKQSDGAVSYINSKGTFQENSTLKFIENTAVSNGGAVFFSSGSDVRFDEHSRCIVKFHNNEATQGGAVYSESNTNITLGGQSKVIFTNNSGTFGGVVYCYNNTFITTKTNSIITFTNNKVLKQGGGLALKHKSDVKFNECSFYCNTQQ